MDSGDKATLLGFIGAFIALVLIVGATALAITLNSNNWRDVREARAAACAEAAPEDVTLCLTIQKSK